MQGNQPESAPSLRLGRHCLKKPLSNEVKGGWPGLQITAAHIHPNHSTSRSSTHPPASPGPPENGRAGPWHIPPGQGCAGEAAASPVPSFKGTPHPALKPKPQHAAAWGHGGRRNDVDFWEWYLSSAVKIRQYCILHKELFFMCREGNQNKSNVPPCLQHTELQSTPVSSLKEDSDSTAKHQGYSPPRQLMIIEEELMF